MDTERIVSGLSAAASGLGAVWAFAGQAAEVVFGLPIQVVLACLASSAAARTYVGSIGVVRTTLMIAAYAALGAWTVPLVIHLLGFPASVQAGVGVLISGGAQVPSVRDWVIDFLKGLLHRRTGDQAPPGDSK